MFVGLHLLVTRQEGVLFLKDEGVLVQEIASVRVSQGLLMLLLLLVLLLPMLLLLLVLLLLVWCCCCCCCIFLSFLILFAACAAPECGYASTAAGAQRVGFVYC